MFEGASSSTTKQECAKCARLQSVHMHLCVLEKVGRKRLFSRNCKETWTGQPYVAAGTEDVNKHMCCSALCACGCLYPPFRELSLRASLDPAHHSSNKLRGLLRWPLPCHCQVFHAQKLEEDEVCGSFRHCLHSAFVFRWRVSSLSSSFFVCHFLQRVHPSVRLFPDEL